jgi:hypothetical protein
LLADRRQPLRFTLWTLIAVWVTATVAAGATYLLFAAAPESHYDRRDYSQPRPCVHAPPRGSLVQIHGFRPLPPGDVVFVKARERLTTPEVVYVWRDPRGCVARWSLEGTR